MNTNYMFVLYDVNERRVSKVFKICKRYLTHCQNSIFRGKITESKVMKLRDELNKIIKDDDNIIFIKLKSSSDFEEEILTKKKFIKTPKNFL